MCGQNAAEEVSVERMKSEEAPTRKLRSIAQLRCDFWRRQTDTISDKMQPEDTTSVTVTSASSAEVEQKPKLKNLEELMSQFKQQKQPKPDSSSSTNDLMGSRHVAGRAEVSTRCEELSREVAPLPEAKYHQQDYASTASTAHSEADSSETSSPRLSPASAAASAPTSFLSADAAPFLPDASCHNVAGEDR